jgi:hypothetical protein
LSAAAVFHKFRREGRAAQEYAEASISVATEQEFPHWMAFGSILRGWALVQQGQAQEGIEQIIQGLLTYRATGAELLRPYFLALLAEAHGTMGQPEAGLTALAEALALVDKTGERWYEAELHRLNGEPNKPNHSNSVLPPAWLACGSIRGSAPKPTSCWRRFTAGSPRALTRPTSRRPKHCWRS